MGKSVSYDTNRARPGANGQDTEKPDTPDGWSVGEYAKLNQAFTWFNERLFDNKLPEVFFTIARHRGAGGYFLPNSMNSRKFDETGERLPVEFKLHEIPLMPDAMYSYDDRFILSILVHEMAHLWQAENGKPSRGGYHNGEWAGKMEEIGLMPSSLGTLDTRNPDRPARRATKDGGSEPAREGTRTGPRMGHYIIKDGRFDIFCRQLLDDGFSFGFDASPRMSKKAPKSKFKYTCPACNANAWAKSGHKLGCWNTDKCGGARMEQEEEED